MRQLEQYKKKKTIKDILSKIFCLIKVEGIRYCNKFFKNLKITKKIVMKYKVAYIKDRRENERKSRK